GERQESHFASVLDRGSNLTLLLRGQTGDAAGTDLAAVGDEETKGLGVLVVHLFDAFSLQWVLLRTAGLLHPELLLVIALHFCNTPYRLDLRAPGSSPPRAMPRKRTRDRPNLRR